MTDRQAPPDSQAGVINVFEQPLKNCFKDNNIPPTPRVERGGIFESEKVKHQNGKNEIKENTQQPKRERFLQEHQLHESILAVFNEILPELPRAEMLTASRSQILNLRITEDIAREKLSWWSDFFKRVRLFPWLMGQNPNNWKATFDWLIGEDGMRKVIEGSFTKELNKEYTSKELLQWQRKFTDERGIVDGKALLQDWREKTGRY